MNSVLREVGMATQPHLRLSSEALVEITRRAARGGLHTMGTGTWQTNLWAQYALILALATLLLEQAPQDREECEEFAIEEKMGQAMAQIAGAVHSILPGGIMEIVSYLPEEQRKEGWGRGVNWDSLK